MGSVTALEVPNENEGGNEDGNPIGGPGFNFNTVEWLETVNGFVSRSLTVKYPG